MVKTTKDLVAADGKPLKLKVARALFRSRARAFGLALPLLAFILVGFIVPISLFMTNAFYDARFSTYMPKTTSVLKSWNGIDEPSEKMFQALAEDLIINKKDKTIGKVGIRVNREMSGSRSLLLKTTRKVPKMNPPYKEEFVKIDKRWGELKIWQSMKVAAKVYTIGHLVKSFDLKLTGDGHIVKQPEERQIHIVLFLRTLEISVVVTLACLILGYPVSYLLASLNAKTANLLLILVLLPFWTSLLVRTTAWIAMLQGQGVMNDLFVLFGFASDEDRFSLIYNKTGTLIAMTHILLPFMILPIYSVMKTISPSYLKAAKSMGASNFTAFWRVYAPLTVPDIGAGGILVFILAIGYYITPALVGGQNGIMISNIIDFHMRSTLNWNFAAALGLVLLVFVLFMFWIYDRVVGIDNMKLG